MAALKSAADVMCRHSFASEHQGGGKRDFTLAVLSRKAACSI
jgi:hypothetical protein